jgi:vanillate O-demethylase monooxygenase subunit
MARDYDLDPAQDHKFSSFNDLIVGQDRPVVESQRPEELPYDLAAELHIRGADRVSLEYRRWLVELARSLAAPEG